MTNPLPPLPEPDFMALDTWDQGWILSVSPLLGLTQDPTPTPLFTQDQMLELQRATWDAATAAERERCAKAAEEHYIFGHAVAGPHFANALAGRIRAGTPLSQAIPSEKE